ncbi:uncharacterized protein DUF4224 [Paraburkholderia sp. BL8N3]|nr:DUF4224 domain-containing protein [Paraburkholderia sp. BL8N3]TCK44030.1 uncharacterized protein DUF4224 [Paraburkholderia sp. BL8N3]
MDAADLKRVTGKTRNSKQAEWFKATFGVDVARDGNGAVVMTWQTFEALTAKLAGVGGDSAPAASAKPRVYPLRRAAA